MVRVPHTWMHAQVDIWSTLVHTIVQHWYKINICVVHLMFMLNYNMCHIHFTLKWTTRFTLDECDNKMAIAVQKTIFCCNVGTTNC